MVISKRRNKGRRKAGLTYLVKKKEEPDEKES